jgi:ABC-type antimicrobial peptide transport system permease subunit
MSIILLAYIFIVSRMKEFAILEALGYQRTKVILKVITEFGFVSIIAWVLGFVITELIAKLINYFLLDPVAIAPISALSLDIVIFSLPMLVILSFSLVFLVLLKFRNMDPIVIIEQR